MAKRECVYVSAAFLGVVCFCVRMSLAADQPTKSGALPLTVPVGAPLHIILTKRVPVKHTGVPIEGKVAEDVYVFDRLVIPANSQVTGHVTKVDTASRASSEPLAIANGNFSPLRHAHVDFTTLVEADGKRIPLHTNVSQGAPSMVHMVAGGNAKKEEGANRNQSRGGSSAGVESGKAAISNVTSPGKVQRLKAALWARLPYHRSCLPVGTTFTAELKTPLAFGGKHPQSSSWRSWEGLYPPAVSFTSA